MDCSRKLYSRAGHLSSDPTHENLRGHSHGHSRENHGEWACCVETKHVIQSVITAGILMGITVRMPAVILV